jgi:hypothetical protein
LKTILTSAAGLPWSPGSGLYGSGSIYEERELVQLKVLGDRRADAGGIAFLVRFTPPEDRLIRLVAVARSDEHVYVLDGGYCNKAGRPLRVPGDYAFNPAGHVHSAFIGAETISLVIYAGEADEIRAFDVIVPV